MRAADLAILFVTLATAAAFPNDSPAAHPVTILPEVQKQLDDARDCSTKGTLEIAIAHANLILVDDEVTYEIEYQGVPNDERGRCKKALDCALGAWQKALDQTLTFKAVADPEKADMVIRFKPNVMMGNEEVAGYVNWKRTLKADAGKVQTVNFKSVLQIRTISLNGELMPLECVRHEVAHEVGHVLGLDDSNTTGDLMGPLDINRPVGGPQPHEAAVIKRLRDEAHKLRADALSKCQR
jgi:predicted Zn-dependent protease